jgi:hypothetical protein
MLVSHFKYYIGSILSVRDFILILVTNTYYGFEEFLFAKKEGVVLTLPVYIIVFHLDSVFTKHVVV